MGLRAAWQNILHSNHSVESDVNRNSFCLHIAKMVGRTPRMDTHRWQVTKVCLLFPFFPIQIYDKSRVRIVICSIYGYFPNRIIIFERKKVIRSISMVRYAATIEEKLYFYYPNKIYTHKQRVMDFGLRIMCALCMLNANWFNNVNQEEVWQSNTFRMRFERDEKKRTEKCYPKKNLTTTKVHTCVRAMHTYSLNWTFKRDQ